MFRGHVAVLLLVVAGCGPLFNGGDRSEPEHAVTPKPAIVTDVDAGQCLAAYGHGIATAFENAADAFDRHESSLSIVKRMGDELEPARVSSFLPPMQALTAAAPKRGATEAEREAADKRRAEMLRTWAKQLKGGEPR